MSLLLEHFQNRKTEYRAAGILPFTCNAVGEIVVLLGAERAKPRRYAARHPRITLPDTGASVASGTKPCGRGRGGGLLPWRDFGGSREAQDADCEATAAREFSEETLGMFGGASMDSRSIAHSTERMASALRLHRSDTTPTDVLRIESVPDGSRTANLGKYVMFVARVAFLDPLLLRLAAAENHLRRCLPGCEEKADFVWVSALSLLHAVEASGTSGSGNYLPSAPITMPSPEGFGPRSRHTRPKGLGEDLPPLPLPWHASARPCSSSPAHPRGHGGSGTRLLLDHAFVATLRTAVGSGQLRAFFNSLTHGVRAAVTRTCRLAPTLSPCTTQPPMPYACTAQDTEENPQTRGDMQMGAGEPNISTGSCGSSKRLVNHACVCATAASSVDEGSSGRGDTITPRGAFVVEHASPLFPRQALTGSHACWDSQRLCGKLDGPQQAHEGWHEGAGMVALPTGLGHACVVGRVAPGWQTPTGHTDNGHRVLEGNHGRISRQRGGPRRHTDRAGHARGCHGIHGGSISKHRSPTSPLPNPSHMLYWLMHLRKSGMLAEGQEGAVSA
eukprot:jgi/Mesvir1/24946/Mv16920-RA.1